MSIAQFAVVGVTGLVVRLVYVWGWGNDLTRGGDAQSFYWAGGAIAAGDGYVRLAPSGELIPSAEHPPIFPGLIGLLRWIGIDSAKGLEVVLALLAATVPLLVLLMAARVAGSAGATAAGLLAAVHPLLVQPAGDLMGESIYVPLVAATVLLAMRAADQETVRAWVFVGCVGGLAALVRAEAVLITAGLALPVLWWGHGRWRSRLVMLGACAAAGMAVLLPWMVRNEARFTGFVPISNNGGTVVGGSNCAQTYEGQHLGSWSYECVLGYAALTGPPTAETDESQAFAQMRDVGAEFATDHLDDLPRVVAARFARTWGLWATEPSLDFDENEARTRSWQAMGYVMYYATLPLAVTGVFILRRQRALLWPLLAPAVTVSLTAALTYGSHRIRTPFEPSLCVLAGVAVLAIASLIRGGARADVGPRAASST